MLKKFFTSKPKKTKYSFSALDLGYPSWIRFRKSFYVEVNEKGQVVNSGNPLWSEAPKERVHLIYLPEIYNFIFNSQVYVKLTQKVGQAEVSVNVQLQAHFAGSKDEDIEFNPQEVYEKITLQGYLHLDDLIRGDFLKAAEEDKAIQKAFTRYVKHERPVLFIEELSKAIRGLEFSGKLLSNMERIDAQVDFNTVTATLKASFNGN